MVTSELRIVFGQADMVLTLDDLSAHPKVKGKPLPVHICVTTNVYLLSSHKILIIKNLQYLRNGAE